MKKYIYTTGILSANLMFIGSIFKVQHWPGASILLALSVLCLCALFLPFALHNAYKNSATKKYKATYIVAYFVFSIVFISALFKIGQMPGAGWLMVIGIPLPIVVFLPVYLYQTRKDKKYSMTNFMGIMFGLTFLAVMSSMLAINVSSSVLKEFELQFISNQNLIENVYADNTDKSDNAIDNKAKQICKSINSLKHELLLASGNRTDSLAIIDLRYVNSLTAPRQVFCIKESENLNVLKNQIISFKESLKTTNQKALEELSKQLLNVDDKVYGDNNEIIICWEEYRFRETNLVMALDYLTRIERNVRFIQNEYKSI